MLYETVSVAVATFPTASRAVTVSTLSPTCSATPVSDQLVVPVAVPLPPRSFDHVTCVTPMLSPAVPARLSGVVVVLYVGLVVGVVIATVGTIASDVTVSTAVPTLPAASCAVTVTTFAPGCRAIPLVDQLVVPVAVPLPPRSLTHVTWVTPTLSLALPLTASVVAFVE